jgi:two-component system, NarL family, response regulator LiaR
VSKPIRVFITDDHAIVRKGIRSLLETEPALEVVGEAANGVDAIPKIAALRPDVILMDLEMPELGGIEAIQHLTASDPGARILVLTSFATEEKVFAAIKAGALGYLLKDSSPDELVSAIQEVYRGQSSLHPKIARMLLRELSAPPAHPPAQSSDPLTQREVGVLQLVARGLSNQEIAGELVISATTVYTHASNILSKLHLASRTQAALYALREGLASLDET